MQFVVDYTARELCFPRLPWHNYSRNFHGNKVRHTTCEGWLNSEIVAHWRFFFLDVCAHCVPDPVATLHLNSHRNLSQLASCALSFHHHKKNRETAQICETSSTLESWCRRPSTCACATKMNIISSWESEEETNSGQKKKHRERERKSDSYISR